MGKSEHKKNLRIHAEEEEEEEGHLVIINILTLNGGTTGNRIRTCKGEAISFCQLKPVVVVAAGIVGIFAVLHGVSRFVPKISKFCR